MALCVPRIAGARVLGRGDHDSADTCYVHFRSAIGLTTRNRVTGDGAALSAPVCRRRSGKVPRNFLLLRPSLSQRISTITHTLLDTQRTHSDTHHVHVRARGPTWAQHDTRAPAAVRVSCTS